MDFNGLEMETLWDGKCLKGGKTARMEVPFRSVWLQPDEAGHSGLRRLWSLWSLCLQTLLVPGQDGRIGITIRNLVYLQKQ